MSTDEYVPSEGEMRDAYRAGREVLALDFGEGGEERADAELYAFLARVRAEAVEDYKRNQVKIHISPPAPAPSLVTVRPCPRCGF